MQSKQLHNNMSTVNGILKTKVIYDGYVSEDDLEEIISEIVAAANEVKEFEEEQRMVVFRPNLASEKKDYIRMVRAIEKEGHKATVQGAGLVNSINIATLSGGYVLVHFIWLAQPTLAVLQADDSEAEDNAAEDNEAEDNEAKDEDEAKDEAEDEAKVVVCDVHGRLGVLGN